MYSLTVDLKDFSSAHRLIKNYQGKCNHLHGHNYAVRIVIEANTTDDNDMLLDFSLVRHLCNAWIQTHLDHATLVCCDDRPLLEFLEQNNQKKYVMPYNTTVERVAEVIYHHLQAILLAERQQHTCDFSLTQVEVWESQHCGVMYSAKTTQFKGQAHGE